MLRFAVGNFPYPKLRFLTPKFHLPCLRLFSAKPNMTEKRPKYMNWILECINLLRSRKSRPDLERICRTMLKCHGIDERDTEEDLSMLIANGIVTKRSFKGAISYRNASGWHRVLASGKVSRAARWVGEAIRALDRGCGVSAVDIEKYISARHPYYHNLKARIKIALKEDLDHGRIWCVSDGMYRLLESAEVSLKIKITEKKTISPYSRVRIQQITPLSLPPLMSLNHFYSRSHFPHYFL